MPSYSDEPDFVLPFAQQKSLPFPRRAVFLLVTAFLLFLFFHNAVPLYTDWLWFKEVGYTRVFLTAVTTKTLLFFLFGGLFFLLFYLNVAYARRQVPEVTERLLREVLGPGLGASLWRGLARLLFLVAAFLSLWAGRLAAESWTSFLECLSASPFRTADPVFGKDISFYVFRLPFLDFAQNFFLISLLITLAAVVLIHVGGRTIENWAGLRDSPSGVRGQLLLLLGLLAVTQAVGTRFAAYGLLTQPNGVFTGAGYADLTFRLFALNTQIVVLVLIALSCLVAMLRGRNLRIPVVGAVVWLVCVALLGGILPGIMQKLSVEPNQLAMEREYIARNIRYTRQGYGLNNVRQVPSFPADESLNTAGLRANQDTLANVRLWDYPYLGKVYAQTQTVKTFYKFEQAVVGAPNANNVDIDRYVIGGKQRQVMLAARELDPDSLPADAQNWQNKRLGFTHGYGLVMSPVNTAVQGTPQYFIEGFPPKPSPEAASLKVTQPKIYYGLLSHEYVFVNTTQEEFDPTLEGQARATAQEREYTGKGGIRIGDAPLAKMAFSIRLGDANTLLAKGFKPTTRVLFRRDIRERVQLIAPFVQQDSDPYLVVTDDGRLVWMIDCYTLSDRYPYSTPVTIGVNPMMSIAPNYIRNSIKAVVDAYDGSVTLYLADPRDPIAQTYSRMFPGLLKPIEAMPNGLRAHIRYPEDLFRLQRSVYATYHVDDPGVFFRKEDAWAIPTEPVEENGVKQQRQIEPYYVIMRLPSVSSPARLSDEEFLLMSPLAPLRQEAKNILGWMCARCDSENYGQLVLYRFPQERSVNGPSQTLSLINGDSTISKELTLLRSGGSTATFGNVLVIPIERSLLTIAPLYVESTNAASRIPQLQRVAVAFGSRVAMDTTLESALTRLFTGYESGSEPGTPPPSGKTPPPMPASVRLETILPLIEKVDRQFETAQSRLKVGDLVGYGEAMKEVERTVKELRQATRPK